MLYITYLKSFRTEIKLIVPNYITKSYFDTKLSSFGLTGVPMIAIFIFWKSMSELFEEIQYKNLKSRLNTLQFIHGTILKLWCQCFCLGHTSLSISMSMSISIFPWIYKIAVLHRIKWGKYKTNFFLSSFYFVASFHKTE